jgi:probable selenium-dependent hydroxylase accessory protein YqeC
MWYIRKIDPLDLIADIKYSAFVGAGGKTSLIEYLAEKSARKNKTTVITTTTKIYAREPYVTLAWRPNGNGGGVNPIRIGKTAEGGKLTAVTFDDIRQLGQTFDTVLIEADGAKGKPLKYPAPYEPVIPPFSEMVFVLAGLDSLYRPVSEKVFRWHIMREKGKVNGDEIISPDNFSCFFTGETLLKDIGDRPCTIVLNKYDALMQKKAFYPVIKSIVKKTGVKRVIVTSLFFRIFYEIQLRDP